MFTNLAGNIKEPIPQHISQPIDWSAILAYENNGEWTPHSVRRYLVAVVERLNQHFAMVMGGRQLGSIELTRLNRVPTKPPVRITLSTWRCSQLFPQKVSLSWLEKGLRKRFHMTAFALWIKSTNRKEVLLETAGSSLINGRGQHCFAIRWLKEMLTLADAGKCTIVFDALNVRQAVYKSFWLVNGRKTEWSPRRISEALYSIFPNSRPIKGKRIRLKGKSVIDIPSQEVCCNILERIRWKPLRL